MSVWTMTEKEMAKHIEFQIIPRPDLCGAMQVVAKFQFSMVSTFDEPAHILDTSVKEAMTRQLIDTIRL
jgi:hypothetical protein